MQAQQTCRILLPILGYIPGIVHAVWIKLPSMTDRTAASLQLGLHDRSMTGLEPGLTGA